MSKIGMIHYKAGDTDGVSLEMNKWKLVLEKMGHQVVFIAGSLGNLEGYRIKELNPYTEEFEKLHRNSFNDALIDYAAQGEYCREVDRAASAIKAQLEQIIRKENLDSLNPHNVWSVGWSFPLAKALAMIVEEHSIPAHVHHHDFYWEIGTEGKGITCTDALEYLERFMPPRHDLITHSVINSLAQKQLSLRKGIASDVIPNVFDFHAPGWKKDSYNRDFREVIGVSESDLLILQATRICPHKGVELAIDLVNRMNAAESRGRLSGSVLYDGRTFGPDDQIVLVCAGYSRDDYSGDYLERLKIKAERAGIEIRFIGDRLIRYKRSAEGGAKYYSLWDSYVFADFIAYPTVHEGWGNQLLEAVYAGRPYCLFEYPVYEEDVKPAGFKGVSLGNRISGTDDLGLVQIPQAALDKACREAVSLLTRRDLYEDMVRHNFSLCSREFSYTALEGYLKCYYENSDCPQKGPLKDGNDSGL